MIKYSLFLLLLTGSDWSDIMFSEIHMAGDLMISIIIPTYNNTEGYKECLNSIIKYTDTDNIELVVIANGSERSVIEYTISVIHNFKQHKIVRHVNSIGYTKATNNGLSIATGDYIVLLNDDTILLEQRKNQWIDELMKPFKGNTQIAMTGPLRNYIKQLDLNFLLFFCVMIPKRIITEIGLLDEQFNPGGFEDADYCLRIHSLGYSTQIVPSTQPTLNGNSYSINFPIYHKAEVTVNTLPGWEETFNSNFNKLLNKWRNI